MGLETEFLLLGWGLVAAIMVSALFSERKRPECSMTRHAFHTSTPWRRISRCSGLAIRLRAPATQSCSAMLCAIGYASDRGRSRGVYGLTL
jgi:hypothetical protein